MEELEKLKATEEGTPKTQEETPRAQQAPEEEEAPSSLDDSIASVDSVFHSGDSATTLPGRDRDAPGVLDRGGGGLLEPRVSGGVRRP